MIIEFGRWQLRPDKCGNWQLYRKHKGKWIPCRRYFQWNTLGNALQLAADRDMMDRRANEAESIRAWLDEYADVIATHRAQFFKSLGNYTEDAAKATYCKVTQGSGANEGAGNG